MVANSFLGEAERVGDVLIGVSGGEQPDDLQLPW